MQKQGYDLVSCNGQVYFKKKKKKKDVLKPLTDFQLVISGGGLTRILRRACIFYKRMGIHLRGEGSLKCGR